MRCMECGHPLDLIASGAPCPECGHVTADDARVRKPLPPFGKLVLRFAWPLALGVPLVFLVLVGPEQALFWAAAVLLVVGPINSWIQVDAILRTRVPARVLREPAVLLLPKWFVWGSIAAVCTAIVFGGIGFGACVVAVMVSLNSGGMH